MGGGPLAPAAIFFQRSVLMKKDQTQKNVKTLKLNRETLRDLEDGVLQKAAGGETLRACTAVTCTDYTKEC
jgi:hypothetical protein